MSASPPPPTSPRPARRRPRPTAVAAGLLAAALIVVFLLLPMLHAAREERAQTLDTNAAATDTPTTVTVAAGDRTCVPDLDVEEARVDVRLLPGFAGTRAPVIEVSVRDRGGAVVARATARDYASRQPIALPVDVGRPRRDTTICVRNAGSDDLTLAQAAMPQEGQAPPPARIDVSTRPFRSVERLPVALTRASYFKSDVVSRPLIVALLCLVLALVAAAVVLVLRGRDDGDGA